MFSLTENSIQCSGTFRYNSDASGTARYSCSDGETGKLRIEAEGPMVGSGKGTSTKGPVELVFGYSLERVNRKLPLR